MHNAQGTRLIAHCFCPPECPLIARPLSHLLSLLRTPFTIRKILEIILLLLLIIDYHPFNDTAATTKISKDHYYLSPSEAAAIGGVKLDEKKLRELMG